MRKSLKRRITGAYFDFIRNQDFTVTFTNGLVYRMANNHTEIEEFMLLADEALAHTIAEFDCNGGGSFKTLLYTKIKNTLRHARDVEKRASRINLLDNEILANLPDHKGSPNVLVQDCLDCLDEKARRVIVGIFFGGKTLREIAAEEGTNHIAIFTVKQKALERIRTICSV